MNDYLLGLKLWSTNTGSYYDEALRLYAASVYDYLELYVVPGSLETIRIWQSLDLPFTIHAPHFVHGSNIAVDALAESNRRMYDEVKTFADELGADTIIYHGGNRGSIDTTIRQLIAFDDPRIVIENKPYHTLKDKRLCIGATHEDIRQIMEEVGCGFCLDFGHALCSANSQGMEPYAYISAFAEFCPTMYHISGLPDLSTCVDTHARLNAGKMDLEFIRKLLPPKAKVSIETTKSSTTDLKDFEEDVLWMRSI